MARRIEIELTSARPDGTWTWRAAGAKQPKGVLEGKLLYEGAAVGDVVRAEADFEIEGIFVTAVLPPKGKERKEPERLEIIGTPREHQGVTSSLVPKSDRGPRRDRDRDRDRGGPPREGGRGGPPREGGRGPRREGERTGGPRDGAPRGPRAPRAEGRDRPTRPAREPRPARDERPAPPKPKRLSPQNVHRAAVLESLSPEQRPVAEQVLRGGIPGLRQAVELQNAKLREAGEPEVHAEPLVAMAEELLPRLKAAEWRDRAEAAAKDVDEIALRDLRSVVAGADAVARDDEARVLASTLREALDRRVAKQREEWVAEIDQCLGDGRLVRALRVSARPPDPGTRFPAEVATKLAEAAGAALTPDVAPDRWAVVLDAVASSPVRRQVKPVGLPAEPGEQLLAAAKQAAGLVPALAPMLGLDMPPPPPPAGARGARRPAPGRRPVPPPPSAKATSAPARAPAGTSPEPAATADGDHSPVPPPAGDGAPGGTAAAEDSQETAGPAVAPAAESAPVDTTAVPERAVDTEGAPESRVPGDGDASAHPAVGTTAGPEQTGDTEGAPESTVPGDGDASAHPADESAPSAPVDTTTASGQAVDTEAPDTGVAESAQASAGPAVAAAAPVDTTAVPEQAVDTEGAPESTVPEDGETSASAAVDTTAAPEHALDTEGASKSAAGDGPGGTAGADAATPDGASVDSEAGPATTGDATDQAAPGEGESAGPATEADPVGEAPAVTPEVP